MDRTRKARSIALEQAAEKAEAKMIARNASRSDRMPGCKFPLCYCNPAFKVCENRELTG